MKHTSLYTTQDMCIHLERNKARLLNQLEYLTGFLWRRECITFYLGLVLSSGIIHAEHTFPIISYKKL